MDFRRVADGINRSSCYSASATGVLQGVDASGDAANGDIRRR